jgi:hypothetical protein
MSSSQPMGGNNVPKQKKDFEVPFQIKIKVPGILEKYPPTAVGQFLVAQCLAYSCF